MKKLTLVLVIAGLLSSCGNGTTEQTQTRSGIIMGKMGSEYILQTSDDTVNITSTKVNLETYMKKQVEVKGMFSGSTLYVDEIIP